MEKISAEHAADFSDRLLKKGSQILTLSLHFLSGFILSGADLFAVKVPLGVSLAAVCSGNELVLTVLGAALGGILRLDGTEMLCCIIPLTGAVGTVCVLEKLRIRKKRTAIVAVSVFLLCFSVSTILMFSENTASLNKFLLNLCSALFCFGSVFFYSGTVNCIKRSGKVSTLDNHSLICVMMSLCTLLLGLSEISILSFRPARFFGSFVILCASSLFAQAGGSIAGVSMGTCVAVSGTSVALSLCYGISGLASGIFSKHGQFVTALIFTAVTGTASIIDSTQEGIAVFAEAAAASALFVAIPKKHLRSAKEIFLPHPDSFAKHEHGSIKARILSASEAIGSVSDCVKSVSKGIDALTPASDIVVCMRVKERVCSDCKLKDSFCPENGDFAAITEKLARGETIRAEDFSLNFNTKCPSVPRIADCFNRLYSNRSAINALQASSARSRELACGQFDWISDLLREFSTEIDGLLQIHSMKEKTAARVLTDNDFNVINATCVQPFSGALKLSCTVESIPPATSLSYLTSALSAELEAEFLPPKIKEVKDGKELIFIRKEIYDVKTGIASSSCGNEKLCGDYSECFRTESKVYVILSDGMGTGGRAAIDSAMTVELFSRLIKAGISLDTALNITNSALAVKSDDESLSTLDIAEIDVFSGRTTVYKAGAAPSFYTCSGRVKFIETPSTPLGILNKASFSKYEINLKGGDMLVMMSDGIFGCGSLWIQNEIAACRGTAATDFSELILNTAKRKCGEKYDDMTVITVTVEEN